MRVTEIRAAGKPHVMTAGGRITIMLPIKVMHRSARKQIIGPALGTESSYAPIKLTPFQLALLRGHRWLALVESRQVASLKEISQREGVDASLVSRLINFTTLAPQIVETILGDTLPREVTLLNVGIDLALAWNEQLAVSATLIAGHESAV